VIEIKKTSELSGSYSDREIVMAEACEHSELEPGIKKSTRGRPVKI
jgi:hypothetical protein